MLFPMFAMMIVAFSEETNFDVYYDNSNSFLTGRNVQLYVGKDTRVTFAHIVPW